MENKKRIETKTAEEIKPKKITKKIAIIRIRGISKIKKEKKDTLNMLRLYKKNYCLVYPAIPGIIGMVKKIQEIVTWGEIDDSTIKLLKEKRGEKTKDRTGKEIIKPFFRLHPPRGGFEKKGIKVPYKVGGASGYRGDKINDLIKKMI